ncbi:MAG: V-type ATPase subunit [Candidatus Altiarchaeota archaeon]|nr:V-type ATPase subunit [Candidatus Altiarchaeota archaeon]
MNLDMLLSRGRPESYAYMYGMLSGMNARLLGRAELESVASAGGVADAIASLEKTDYSAEVASLSPALSDSDVERAIERHFMRVYGEILAALPEDDRQAFDSVILGEADLKNIKTILRGLHRSIPQSEIKLMLLSGGVPAGITDRMAGAAGIDGAMTFLSAFWDDLPRELDGGLAGYRKTGRLVPLEMALDRSFMERWLSRKPLEDYVKMKIDSLNVLNLFRCRLEGMPYARHIIPGGLHLSIQTLMGLETLPPGDIAASLAATPYGGRLTQASARGSISVALVEQALEDSLEDETGLMAMVRPLSVWSALAFLQRKQRESRQVRAALLLSGRPRRKDAARKIIG